MIHPYNSFFITLPLRTSTSASYLPLRILNCRPRLNLPADNNGSVTKARDFEGVGGPEDKRMEREVARPGDQDVQGNVRQGYDSRY